MHFLRLVAAITMALGVAVAQVTETITPRGSPPPGCSASRPGTYEMAMIPLPKGTARAVSDAPPLRFTISNGVLTDAHGRIGYIADNYQFQFDGPPQAGALFTGGFSICQNGTVALGSSAVFWACPSGAFSNLYDRNWAPQCFQSFFQTYDTSPKSSGGMGLSSGSGGGSGGSYGSYGSGGSYDSGGSGGSGANIRTSYIATSTDNAFSSGSMATNKALLSDVSVASDLASNSTSTSVLVLTSSASNVSTVSVTSTKSSTGTSGRVLGTSSSATPKSTNNAHAVGVTAQAIAVFAGLAGIALA